MDTARVQMLAERAIGGDQDAANRLMIEIRPAMKLVASHWWAPGLEKDDMLAYAMMGAAKGLQNYDPSKGSSALSFLTLAAKRSCNTALIQAQRPKNKALNDAMLTDVGPPHPGEDDDEQSVETVVADPSPSALDLLLKRELRRFDGWQPVALRGVAERQQERGDHAVRLRSRPRIRQRVCV